MRRIIVKEERERYNWRFELRESLKLLQKPIGYVKGDLLVFMENRLFYFGDVRLFLTRLHIWHFTSQSHRVLYRVT